MADKLADEILRDFNQVSSQRGTLEGHWEEIAQRVLPNYSNSFSSSVNGFKTEGEKKTDFIFDSTASIALNRFSAILDSLLTPRNSKWHSLKPDDPYLMKQRPVRLYFEEVNRVLFKQRYSPTANFAGQNQQNYKSLGAFGTGCLFTDELFGKPGLRYKAIHLGEVYFVENHQGVVDKAYRYFSLTGRQAVQMFGPKCPERIRSTAETDSNKKWIFLHCVKPRVDYDPNRLDGKGMPIASYYVSKDEGAVIDEGGYTTFPYAISRYEQAPGEVYGRSPAMEVLPAIKTLNEEKKTILKQGQRTVDPVLLLHDDGILDGVNLTPGATNYGGVSADGRPLVHTLPVGNIMIGKDLMDDERAVINDAFLVTIFQILTDNPQMTATEVVERTREKGILLAPTIGRQQSEYLGPLIEREIDILSRQQLLPPMPEVLREAQGEYRVEYESPLSRVQRAEEAAGLMRAVETSLRVAVEGQNPAILDHYDWDIITPQLADIHGVPVEWLRSKEAIEQIRAGRAQEMEQQQAIQAMPAGAAMIKAVGASGK